ncbi:MAG: hypothetical protein JWM19_6220, partial [Actinomycetia bacterium]|nr:hypothetical protein [Actinomycetes bacterium]
MSVFRSAGGRLRLPGRGRAGLGKASHVTGKVLGAAAICALMLVSVLAATANAAPASPARAHASAARAGATPARVVPAGHAHIDPVIRGTAGTAASSLAADDASGGNLQYGGGPVQHDPTFYAIFWLPSGTNYEPGIVNGNSGYEGLMSRYLQDAGSTNLANLVSQYYDTTSGYMNNIAPSTQYGGAWTDTTSYPESPLLDSDIQAAVNAALAANPSWNDGVNSTFFVFTGYGINSCMNSTESSCTAGISSSQGYCGYHNHYTDANGHAAVYANMPEDESWNAGAAFGANEGCENTNALPNGDIYADNEFAVLSHEQWEAETDPILNAWSNSGGEEIGDLCPSQWGYEPYFGPSNFNVSGNLYLLQELWSNVDGGCGGADGGDKGYYAVYGPYSATAGVSTGTLNLAQTVYVPSVNVVLTPNPTIDWGDGTTSSPGEGSGCVICTLTGSHTYQYDPSATYPKTYQVTVTYNTGCCISYSQSLHIVVFPPAPLAISADNQTMTYGGAVPNFTASYSGFINGDTSSVVQGLTCSAADHNGNPVSNTTPAGTYAINCSGATAPSYYTISYKPGTLTIDPAPLAITANDQETTYGSISFDTSANSMTFSGFVNGEGPSVLGPGLTITSDVSPNSPAGSYLLTPAGADDRNYSVTYDSGNLTVDPAALLITANNKTMIYGEPVPAFDASYTGFVNGDTASALSGLTCGALDANGNPVSSTTLAGTYTITCSGATDANYRIGYQSGTLTVQLFAAGSMPTVNQSGTSCHLLLNGGATVNVAGTLTVDGTSPSALCLNSGTAISAGSIVVQGGVQNNHGTINGTVTTQQRPAPDLLATLPPPSAPAAGCPGTACPEGTNLNSGHTYDLLPGTYSVPVNVNEG